jgi:hypothetical protein
VFQFIPFSATKLSVANSELFHVWNISVSPFLTVQMKTPQMTTPCKDDNTSDYNTPDDNTPNDITPDDTPSGILFSGELSSEVVIWSETVTILFIY